MDDEEEEKKQTNKRFLKDHAHQKSDNGGCAVIIKES